MTIEVNDKLALAKQQLREWHHQQYVAENNVKIAKRIDDTPGTLRQYYGWLNALKLIERGQDLLVGLMHD